MKGVNIGNNVPGFQKVVFESEVEFLAGGAYIDPLSATFLQVAGETKVIPAGSLVGVKDADGVHEIIEVTAGAGAGDPATFSGEILGFVHRDILLDDMPQASVLLSGTVRKEALPEPYLLLVDEIAKKMPRFTFV